ncbi:hypothetical protein [Paraburkholderia franconis]|nr:hypothetical protein [Paraburkholderia franconis]
MMLSIDEFAAVVLAQRLGEEMQIVATAPDAKTISALLKKIRGWDE